MSRNDKRASNTNGPKGETPKAQARREKTEQMRLEQEKLARRRGIVRNVTIGVGILVVALIATLVVLAVRDDSSPIARDDTPGTGTAPPNVTSDGAFTVGQTDAPVTVQIVEDFQCPVCQQFEAAAGDLLDQYARSGDVKLEYRGIAFLDQMSSSRYSSRALNASACVRGDGEDIWKEFHRQLFLQQPPEGGDGLSDTTLVDMAVAAGADPDVATACIEDETYAGWVSDTTNAAGEDGVTGTPTIFVDGEKLPTFSPEQIRAAVDKALEK